MNQVEKKRILFNSADRLLVVLNSLSYKNESISSQQMRAGGGLI